MEESERYSLRDVHLPNAHNHVAVGHSDRVDVGRWCLFLLYLRQDVNLAIVPANPKYLERRLQRYILDEIVEVA